jgi:apolipoprotein N-acyltransferase
MSNSSPTQRWRLWAVLGAGALTAFSLPPWGWWPLSYLGIALFAMISRNASQRPRTQFVLGMVFAIGWFAPGMGWMWFLTPPGYLIAVLLFAMFHGVAAFITSRSEHPTLTGPLAHTLAEALRFSFPFGGVPLASLAVAQASSPLVGLSRIGGPLLLSYVVWQFGFIAARWPFVTARRHVPIAIASLIALVAIGAYAPNGTDTNKSLRIAFVQGGGPQGTLAISTNSRDVVDRHLAATRLIEDAEQLDMVVWPENVIDVDNFYESVEREEIAAEAKRLDTPFVVGITEDVDARFFTNAQIVVNQDGTLGDRYDKVRRVPFGEFVPLRGVLEWLGAPVDRIPRDAQAGTDIASLQVADTKIGVAISWEVFFSGRANEGIDAGGSMLVNPTNGSSYTGTVLQSQQIASSRLRAVETGRWLVQVSPTGFSAFVSPNGEVFDRTAVSEQRVVIRDVPQRTGSTLYSQLGDQPIIILLTALVASLLWVARRRRSWSM